MERRVNYAVMNKDRFIFCRRSYANDEKKTHICLSANNVDISISSKIEQIHSDANSNSNSLPCVKALCRPVHTVKHVNSLQSALCTSFSTYGVESSCFFSCGIQVEIESMSFCSDDE